MVQEKIKKKTYFNNLKQKKLLTQDCLSNQGVKKDYGLILKGYQKK